MSGKKTEREKCLCVYMCVRLCVCVWVYVCVCVCVCARVCTPSFHIVGPARGHVTVIAVFIRYRYVCVCACIRAVFDGNKALQCTNATLFAHPARADSDIPHPADNTPYRGGGGGGGGEGGT